MKAVAFLRVSSDGQDETSFPVQRATIRKYCEEHGYELIHEFEQVDSGFCRSEDELYKKMPQLLRWLEHPPVDYDLLVYYDQTRFARIEGDLLGFIRTVAKRRKIKLAEALDQSANADGVGGAVIRLVKTHAGFEESQTKKVKSVEGAKHTAKLGYRVGGAAPIGYLRALFQNEKPYLAPDGSHWILRRGQRKPNDRSIKVGLVVDPATAETVKAIFRLYCAGEGIKRIARWLNDNGHKTISHRPWTHTAVRGILQDPTYRGQIIYHKHKRKGPDAKGLHDVAEWIITENCHERLCTPEQALYIDQKLKSHQHGGTYRRSSSYLLNGGMMRCTCGSSMVGFKNGSNNRRSYVCGGYVKKTTSCSYYPVDAEALEDQVTRTVQGLLSDPRVIEKALEIEAQATSQAKLLKSRLRELDRQQENLTNAIAEIGLNPALRGKLQAVENERRSVADMLTMEASKDHGDLRRELEELRDSILADDPDQRRQVIKQLVIGTMEVDPAAKKLRGRIGGQKGQKFKGWYPVRDSNP